MKHAQLHDTLDSVNMSGTRPSVKSIVLNVLKACKRIKAILCKSVGILKSLARRFCLRLTSERKTQTHEC